MPYAGRCATAYLWYTRGLPWPSRQSSSYEKPPQASGQFVDVDGRLARCGRAAQQPGQVTGAGRQTRDVDHEHAHADAAHLGRTAAVDQHMDAAGGAAG